MKQLDKHLTPLQRNNEISVWKDTDVAPGKAFEQEIFLPERVPGNPAPPHARVSRRALVIGTLGLAGLGFGVVGLSLYYTSRLASPTPTVVVQSNTASPTANAHSPVSTSPTASTPASPTPPVVYPYPTLATAYTGVLTSDTISQHSAMRFVITTQDQHGTITGTLTVDPPLANRGGSFSGSLNGDGSIQQFIVTSGVSPALSFSVTGHQNNAYSGNYNGTTLDASHDYLEAGTWHMDAE